MKKLKNNIAFKCIMIILFSVSLLVCAAAGLVTISLYADHALTNRGKEALRQSIITGIAYEKYNTRALNYYEEYLMGYDHAQDDYFFSEENTNYSFKAKIVNGDKSYPELVSYEPGAYQYSQTDKYTLNPDGYFKSKSMKLPKDKILSTTPYMCCTDSDLSELEWYDSEYYRADEYVFRSNYGLNYVNAEIIEKLRENYYKKHGYDYFEKKNEGYELHAEDDSTEITYDSDLTEITYDFDESETADFAVEEKEQDLENVLENVYDVSFDVGYEINMVTDGRYYYILENADGVIDYINSLYVEYNDAEISYDMEYDDKAQMLEIEAYISPTLSVELDWYVKKELTAYDGFYNSITLRYLDDMTKYAVPVCVISGMVFIICFVSLVLTAGHKRVRTKNEEGETKIADVIKPGIFDKTPYDIVLLLVAVPFFLGLVNLGKAYYGSIESVIAMACAVICSFLGAFLIMTTAVRLKCGGWSFLKGTLLYKAGKWILSLAGRLLKWLGSALKYLWKHFNLYWKYILIILGVAFVEIFFAVNEEASATFLVIIMEKLCVSVFTAYALINLSRIKKYTKGLAEGITEGGPDTEHMHGEFLEYAKDLGHVNDGIKASVEKQMKSEMMKTELITNVSHDIKTPLTSIINYVDLLGKENIESEKAKEYIEVLNRQSQRLKKLIIDLIDASKASTGNVEVNLERLDLDIILMQLNGEYEEQFEKKELKLVVSNKAKDSHILADQRHIYRVFDNLYVNIRKYAQEKTRVYIDIEDAEQYLSVSIKNISAQELNISGDELMERFTRGDRSRNTEGSGLGLSIAKSLIELQNGKINIVVDGDLYKVELLIPKS